VGQLSTYQNQIALLLHDPNYQLFTQSVLTGYINEARNRVALDTNCLRQLAAGLSFTAGVEAYTPQSFLGALGPYFAQVLGITVYWGTQRIKLNQYSYTQFDANFRRYQTYQGRPVAYARLGANNIYIGPNPDQNYTTDWDISVVPAPLVSDASVEQIPVPFQEPVQYYAAYKAKFQEQAMGEAAIFKQQYLQNVMWCARAWTTRVIPNPYRIGA
jgi:hypothetical protein